MVNFRIHAEDIAPAIQSLERYFRDGGCSLVEAAFRHSYFVHPEAVRGRTPYFPERARRSREYYPGIDKGKRTTWHTGDGREIILDDNSRAQMAWERYTGRKLMRKSGYGVRHIWGNTHNPIAFTAGWNLCYMPFWAGMLTEEQHPLPLLQQAIRQASWDLFFADNPVCDPPDFVSNPGLDPPDRVAVNHLLILYRATHGAIPDPESADGRDSTLSITLEPPRSADFLAALVRTKKAWIEVSYQDGRKEVRPWNAGNMKPTSNVFGNLRSRPEFRRGAWQQNGIASLKVSIEYPAQGTEADSGGTSAGSSATRETLTASGGVPALPKSFLEFLRIQ